MSGHREKIAELTANGRLPEAVAAAKDALASGAPLDGGIDTLLIRLISEGAFRQCVDVLETLCPFERKASPEVYNLLAFLAFLRQDEEAARRALQEGLRHHPEHPVILCAWGTLQWESGDRREAISAWERAFLRAPEWSRIDYLVAVATLGEPLDGPVRRMENAVFRVTPLYLPNATGPEEWHSGQISEQGEEWLLTLAADGRGRPSYLVAGAKVLAVTSDENGLYTRRAEILRVLPSAPPGLALRFLEPIHRIQRRRHVRILAHQVASGSFEGPDRKSIPVTVGSLSASGIAFTSPKTLEPGVKIHLSLVVDPDRARGPAAPPPRSRGPAMQSLNLDAEVMRCTPHEKHHACSARFVISTRDQDTLARLIHLSQLNLRRLERDTR